VEKKGGKKGGKKGSKKGGRRAKHTGKKAKIFTKKAGLKKKVSKTVVSTPATGSTGLLNVLSLPNK